MVHSFISINRISRRAALVSIAGTAGFLITGCGNTAGTASGNKTPTAVATPAATATPTPRATPASTPTSVPAAQPGTTLLTYKGHTSRVVSVAWSPDSKLVASAEQFGSTQVWEAATGKLVFTCKGPSSLLQMTWSADGKYIAGTNSVGVSVWNASDGSLITHYNVQQKGVTALAFSPDSWRIATGSFDKTVQIWQATTGTHLLTYNGHNTANGLPVVSLSWSPDGKQMVSSSSAQGGAAPNMVPSVKVWDTATGKDMLVYNAKSQADSVAWSPDGTFIASEDYLNGMVTLQVWSAKNGRGLALDIDAHNNIKSISWSPNSKYVALAISSYQSLLPTSRAEVRSLGGDSYKLVYTGHQPNVCDVAWSPDGSRIASCSDDKTVQIWQAPS